MLGNLEQEFPKIRTYKIFLTLMLLLCLILLQLTNSENTSHKRSPLEPPNYPVLEPAQKTSSHPLTTSKRPSQYIAHDPILIRRNTDFAALGFPGDGTKENPYRIEGLNITSSTTDFVYSHGPIGLIHIENTTMYFHVKDNLVNGVSRELVAGISLVDAQHGTLATNTIRNTREGISIHFTGHFPMIAAFHTIVVTHNVISDCEFEGIWVGHVKQGTMSYNTVSNCMWGILSSNLQSNTVSFNTVSNCTEEGIWMLASASNTVSHNMISNGIRIDYSGQNTLVNNHLRNKGFVINGWQPQDFIQAEVTNNTVDGRPVIYWQHQVGGTVPAGAGQIILVNTTGVEVTNLSLSGTEKGVFLAYSSGALIHHNTFSHHLCGVNLCYSWNNTVSFNTISHCAEGIALRGSESNMLSFNTVSHCTEGGIWLGGSESNTVSHNIVPNGIYLSYSGQNTLVNNHLSNNGLVILGDQIEHFAQAEVANNTINGLPVTYSQILHSGLWVNDILFYRERRLFAVILTGLMLLFCYTVERNGRIRIRSP